MKLPEVKAVSRALGCSINDVLLSCAAGAMRRYLADKGDRTEDVEIRALAPIDLREPGDLELGNRFGIVAVLLPVGVEHPLERLMTVRRRMLELKTSYEPATTLGLFAALGQLPKIVQDQLSDILASRATAVMTNVPGATEPLTVAGSKLKQSLFWVPQTGDVGMGVSIFSYAGQVQFGLITDAALIPDPEAVVSRFSEEFEKNIYYVLLDPPEEPALAGSERLKQCRHPPGGVVAPSGLTAPVRRLPRSGSCSGRRRGAISGRGRGRDRDCSLPPAQIPACGFPAPGSCRRSGVTGRSRTLLRGSLDPQAGGWLGVPGPVLRPGHCPPSAIPPTEPPSLHALRRRFSRPCSSASTVL